MSTSYGTVGAITPFRKDLMTSSLGYNQTGAFGILSEMVKRTQVTKPTATIHPEPKTPIEQKPKIPRKVWFRGCVNGLLVTVFKNQEIF